MVNISLIFFVVKSFEFLNFGNSAEGTSRHNLRHTAGKYAASVNSRKYAVFAPDRSDVGKRSAVGSYAEIGNFSPDFFFRNIVKRVFEFSLHIREFFGKMFKNVFFDFILTGLSFESVESVEGVIEFFAGVFSYFGVKIFGNVIKFDVLFFFTAGGNDFLDERTLLFDFFVSEQNRSDHVVVGKFFRARFNHHNGVFGSGKIKSQSTCRFLCYRRIDDVFTVDHTYDDRTRRSCPRYIRNTERNRRTEHRKRFGRNIGVDRQRSRNYGYVVEKPFGEQRSDRSVDKSGYENRLIACPALSLFETAGNFTDGVHFFFVIDGKRKEIHTFSRNRRHGNVYHYDRFAASDHAGSVCLLGVLAHVNGNFFTTYRRSKYFVIF